MAEKLTLKILSTELNVLRNGLRALETGFECKLEGVLAQATEKLQSRIGMSGRSFGALRVHGEAGIDVNARRKLIAEMAYLCAERRGFSDGSQEQDWLDAEVEIDGLLLQGWTKNLPQALTAQESDTQEESRV